MMYLVTIQCFGLAFGWVSVETLRGLYRFDVLCGLVVLFYTLRRAFGDGWLLEPTKKYTNVRVSRTPIHRTPTNCIIPRQYW